MKRRNFVKQSIAGAIVAATPLALTGLVRADGGGTGSTSTESTDWWDTTGTTNDSTDESSTTEEWTTAFETTLAGCEKLEDSSIRLSTSYVLNNQTYTGMMCASYVNCPGQKPSLQRTVLVPCDDNPNDGVVNECDGVTLLTGQDAVDFKKLPVCEVYSEP